MIHRIGTFFILLGVLLIVLFIFSDMADAPVCGLFFYGAVLLVVGLFLWFRSPLPAGPPAQRFRLLRNPGKKTALKPEKRPER